MLYLHNSVPKQKTFSWNLSKCDKVNQLVYFPSSFLNQRWAEEINDAKLFYVETAELEFCYLNKNRLLLILASFHQSFGSIKDITGEKNHGQAINSNPWICLFMSQSILYPKISDNIFGNNWSSLSWCAMTREREMEMKYNAHDAVPHFQFVSSLADIRLYLVSWISCAGYSSSHSIIHIVRIYLNTVFCVRVYVGSVAAKNWLKERTNIHNKIQWIPYSILINNFTLNFLYLFLFRFFCRFEFCSRKCASVHLSNCILLRWFRWTYGLFEGPNYAKR